MDLVDQNVFPQMLYVWPWRFVQVWMTNTYAVNERHGTRISAETEVVILMLIMDTYTLIKIGLEQPQ